MTNLALSALGQGKSQQNEQIIQKDNLMISLQIQGFRSVCSIWLKLAAAHQRFPSKYKINETDN